MADASVWGPQSERFDLSEIIVGADRLLFWRSEFEKLDENMYSVYLEREK